LGVANMADSFLTDSLYLSEARRRLQHSHRWIVMGVTGSASLM